MAKKPSLLEINGQLVDASSGQLFHHPRGAVIDGFMKNPRPGRVIKKVASSFTKEHLYKPAQTVHRRAQGPKTLMRSIVKQPSGSGLLGGKLKQLKSRGPGQNPARLSRAMTAMKNSRVSRFGSPAANAKSTLPRAASGAKTDIAAGSTGRKPAASTAVATRPLPSMIASVSHQRLERMLDEALIKADAHKKALNKRLGGKKRLSKHFRFLPRWLAITIAVLVVAGAGGFFAWRNVPYVSMKIASVRSHVKGSLPNYIPSGFRFSGPIQYQPGTISMKYQADAEGRYFTITQQASNWDSSSLEANAVPGDSQVQTSQVKGTTIYNYRDRTTWVNDGSRYTIQDNAQLNYDELRKIAESILNTNL